MSNDNKTLADVQPGGRVRLGDQALSTSEGARRYVADFFATQLRRHDFSGYILTELAADFACALAQHLSAQPSPGGQGDSRSERAATFLRQYLTYLRSSPRQGLRPRWCDVYEALEVAIEALAARQPVEQTFQAGVSKWMGQCFLPSLYSDMTERGDRLLEEVLELLQAHGYDKARVPTLVDYVFSRPVGDPAQEVGGVMVTLAGYCWVAGLDMHAAGDAELARINQPEVMDKIRRKQEAKNALHFDTPLPGHAAPPAQAVDPGALRKMLESWKNSDYPLSYEGQCAQRALDACVADLQGWLDSQAVGNG